jgi:hypothetical protein
MVIMAEAQAGFQTGDTVVIEFQRGKIPQLSSVTKGTIQTCDYLPQAVNYPFVVMSYYVEGQISGRDELWVVYSFHFGYAGWSLKDFLLNFERVGNVYRAKAAA